jgi:hypothetical protein
MEFILNVTEIAASDREALEHVLGQQLRDDQRVVVRVVNRDGLETLPKSTGASDDEESLPDWCNVFEGLSDQEVAAIEEVMLSRADLTRPAG